VSGDLVVYVHTNRLIYRQREEWLKGKTNMWDVFLDDMGLKFEHVELALANLDLSELVLESITFDDGDPLEGSFSTSTNARITLDMGEEEEDGGESSGSDANLDDYDMEDSRI
jgi:hypothetical protein